MQAPKVHAWARQDIVRLRGLGIEPNLDEIVWLAELAALAHTPPGREPPVDPAAPLHFAGSTFWPMHMLAQRWFVQWYEAFTGQPEMQVGIYMFAHVRSKTGDVSLRELSDMDAVAGAVTAWLHNCPIRDEMLPELQERLASLSGEETIIPMPPKNEKGEIRNDADYSTPEDRIASLCQAFEGTTPDFWESEICERQAMLIATARIANENAGGAWANSPLRAQRIANYMNAVKWVVLRHQKEQAA